MPRKAPRQSGYTWVYKPAVAESELWTVKKERRTLRCVARYLPSGIDLRQREGDEFRRAELHKDADLAEIKATKWKQALEARGWSVVKATTTKR